MNYKELARERFERAKSDPYATMSLKDYEEYYKEEFKWSIRRFMFGDNPKLSLMGTGSQLLILVGSVVIIGALCMF